MLAGGAHDEGPDGLLRVPSDGGRLRKGEGGGGGVGGWLGSSSRRRVWPDEEASRRGGGANRGAEKVLKDKKDEISQSKKLLRQAKKDAIKEYCDFDALLAEMGGSFVDGFDYCLHQVKASFPDLNLSHITINAKGQNPARSVESEGTDELFVDDINPDHQVYGEAIYADQEKSVEDRIHQLEVDQTVEEKEEETPVAQQ